MSSLNVTDQTFVCVDRQFRCGTEQYRTDATSLLPPSLQKTRAYFDDAMRVPAQRQPVLNHLPTADTQIKRQIVAKYVRLLSVILLLISKLQATILRNLVGEVSRNAQGRTENRKTVVFSDSRETYKLMALFGNPSPILIERQAKSDPPPVPKHTLIQRLDSNSH